MDEEVSELLSKIPNPEEGSDEAFIRNIIEGVLNDTLNRHVHGLEKIGYKKSRSLKKEAGWVDGKPGRLLQLKFDLMDEAIERFSPFFVEELKKRNAK